MVNDFNVENHIKSLTDIELNTKIKHLITNKNKVLDIKIIIKDNFPIDILNKKFKLYYITYYNSIYSYNDQLRLSSNILLNKKLISFSIHFPKFGRNKFIKDKNNKYREVFETDCDDFNSIDITRLTKKQQRKSLRYDRDYLDDDDQIEEDNYNLSDDSTYDSW